MDWVLGYSGGLHIAPQEYIPAYVPSDVQMVFGAAKGMRDYHYANSYEDYKWMEDKWWFYKSSLFVDQKPGRTPILEFEGLDYRYTVLLDGAAAADGEGLYTPVRLDLSGFTGRTVQVTVALHPIPKREGAGEGRQEASLSCIPPVAYGWDWQPRLVPIGIYRDVTLRWEPSVRMEEVRFFYRLSEDLSRVSGRFEVRCAQAPAQPGARLALTLLGPDGETAFASSAPAALENVLEFEIQNPKLWWCVNQGPQDLYRAKLEITVNGAVLDRRDKRIGFRKIRLVMNQNGWEGTRFPKSQARPPVTIELNGRRIFGKGTNFLPPEILTAKLARSDIYERLVRLAKDCHMNLLRMWGGGIVANDGFFDACDEAGLMVWQEFPLACNNYGDDPHYLRVLDQESRSMILRLKSHPCVILWCGGNELLCSWSGMTNQSHALRLLDANCWLLDPDTPYIMSSPQYGMGHGGYLPLNGDGSEMLSDLHESDMTAYTEFGMPSPSPLEYIGSFTPRDELEKPEPGTAWESHHAVNAWDGIPQTWFCMDMIRAYYGREASLPELVERGIDLQGEIYKQLFEAIRHKWPRASMALNWCFNEPWPTAANNSIVNYPDIPKRGYYGVKAALRDRMLSAGFYKMRWKANERAEAEIYLLNDTPEEAKPFSFTAFLAGTAGNTLAELGSFSSPACPANSSAAAARVTFCMPDLGAGYRQFRFVLRCEDPALSSEYLLFIVE